jgi:hypothetical protein
LQQLHRQTMLTACRSPDLTFSENTDFPNPEGFT